MEPQLPSVPAVEPEKASAMLEDGAMMVDVREVDEWENVRIAEAVTKTTSIQAAPRPKARRCVQFIASFQFAYLPKRAQRSLTVVRA